MINLIEKVLTKKGKLAFRWIGPHHPKFFVGFKKDAHTQSTVDHSNLAERGQSIPALVSVLPNLGDTNIESAQKERTCRSTPPTSAMKSERENAKWKYFYP